MPKFTRLMNDVGYTDDQSKIDLLSVNLSDEMNQLLIGQDMPVDYLVYVTRLHKLDTDVHVVGQQKILRINSRSNPTTRGNLTSSNFTFSFNPNPQPPASNAFSYQPPPSSSQTTTPSLLLSEQQIVPKTCSVRDIISSCRAHDISRTVLLHITNRRGISVEESRAVYILKCRLCQTQRQMPGARVLSITH